MCIYCENYAKRGDELKLGDVFLLEPARFSIVGDGRPYTIPFRYCSACGRDLYTASAVWLDTEDTYVCSCCGFETDDPNKLRAGAGVCPACRSHMKG